MTKLLRKNNKTLSNYICKKILNFKKQWYFESDAKFYKRMREELFVDIESAVNNYRVCKMPKK